MRVIGVIQGAPHVRPKVTLQALRTSLAMIEAQQDLLLEARQRAIQTCSDNCEEDHYCDSVYRLEESCRRITRIKLQVRAEVEKREKRAANRRGSA